MWWLLSTTAGDLCQKGDPKHKFLLGQVPFWIHISPHPIYLPTCFPLTEKLSLTFVYPCVFLPNLYPNLNPQETWLYQGIRRDLWLYEAWENVAPPELSLSKQSTSLCYWAFLCHAHSAWRDQESKYGLLIGYWGHMVLDLPVSPTRGQYEMELSVIHTDNWCLTDRHITLWGSTIFSFHEPHNFLLYHLKDIHYGVNPTTTEKPHNVLLYL